MIVLYSVNWEKNISNISKYMSMLDYQKHVSCAKWQQQTIHQTTRAPARSPKQKQIDNTTKVLTKWLNLKKCRCIKNLQAIVNSQYLEKYVQKKEEISKSSCYIVFKNNSASFIIGENVWLVNSLKTKPLGTEKIGIQEFQHTMKVLV